MFFQTQNPTNGGFLRLQLIIFLAIKTYCMKNILFVVALLAGHSIVAQNVGIGVPAPVQKLEVNGAIKIGTTTTNQPGAIRYNAGKFEGGDGSNWKSLEGTVSGIVGSAIYNNTALLNAGYSFYGELPAALKYNTFNGILPSGTWQPTYNRGIISNVSAPVFNNSTGRAAPVSDGSKLYVPTTSNMYAYDPITDLWSILNNQGLPSTVGFKAIWIGNEFIFISGHSQLNSRKYNILTNSWSLISTVNAPDFRNNFSLVWDGNTVIVWGGNNNIANLNTGAMYNPFTDTWTVMNTSGAPIARQNHTAIWSPTTNRMIVWGGQDATGSLSTGGLYNPATNTWTGATNTTGAPPARTLHTAIWSGTEMIIFGGSFNAVGINTGGRYNPSANSWTATNTISAPVTRAHSAVWTGTSMFVTGGSSSFGQISSSAANSYNPVTNLWTSIFNFSSQEGKDSHSSFLVGNTITIFGGGTTIQPFDFKIPDNNGFRYFLANSVSSVTTTTEEILYLYQKN